MVMMMMMSMSMMTTRQGLVTTTRFLSSVSSFVLVKPPPSSTKTKMISRSSSNHNKFATTARWLSSTALRATATDTINAIEKIPVTLLSGFLGSGKTSTLQHLLGNTDGLKIGVIVNDMASVNIDSKLVKQSDSFGGGGLNSSSSSSVSGATEGIVEMQNGCACCSLADELLTTIETLVDSRRHDDGFDAIVVELSGVADPIAIKQNWVNAKMLDQPVTTKAEMKRIVTLIDASTFGTDWMAWDNVGERGWVADENDCTGQRKVPELLAEQVEAADVLLLNKIDLAGKDQVQIAASLAQQINNKAIIEEVEFGKVMSPTQIIRDDIISIKEEEEEEVTSSSCCSDPGCPSKKEKDDDENDDKKEVAAVSACSSSKSKADDEKAEIPNKASTTACQDADCGDPDCDDHGTKATTTTCQDADCGDPNCDDHGIAATQHDDHSHDHSHSSHSTSTENLGIVNFVYRATRPFEARKLMALLNAWPVPIKENLSDLLQYEKDGMDPAATPGDDIRESPFSGVLRSKGFSWMAPAKWDDEKNGTKGDAWRHNTAMYWSHAGRHFGISTAGQWWDTLPQKDIQKFFKNDPIEYERIMNEDFQDGSPYGDRRQEIVFIGFNIDEKLITESLDACLLGDAGMKRYTEQVDQLKLLTQ